MNDLYEFMDEIDEEIILFYKHQNQIINEFPETKLPYSSGEDPHNAALLLRTAIYAYLAGGDETITLGLITRCLNYLDRLYVPTDDSSLVGGTWSSYPAGNVWYSFVGGEIIYALSLLQKYSRPGVGGGLDFKSLISYFGFSYDSNNDIYVSNINAWQREAGYHVVIDDLSAFLAGMVIDCEPAKFTYKDKPYMIEFWKGQYDISTGCEIGIYKKSDENDIMWQCADDDDMLAMSYNLTNKATGKSFSEDTSIFDGGKHWWLTGFKPGMFSNLDDLELEISITFDEDHLEMFKKFVEALEALGYNVTKDGYTVIFKFKTPTSQPWLTELVAASRQESNQQLVNRYNNVKSNLGLIDNSPDSIEAIFDAGETFNVIF